MDTLLSSLRFDAAGLVPVVAQDRALGRVLMLAYANREAVAATLATGYAHYWSRSRASLWKKGESSGHLQRVCEVRVDCDADALLYVVEQAGPACHTGAPACFFRKVEGARLVDAAPVEPPAAILSTLHAVLLARASGGDERSYTRRLLDAGPEKIAAKIREEADETARALTGEPDENLVREVADLCYHSLVGLVARGLSPERVFAELGRRFGLSGVDEKESRPPSA